MFSVLTAIIFLAFVALGLPDSLLGAGWPVMHATLNASASSAGIITMIIAGNTVISSLLSDRLTHALGVGKLTAICVATTALALFGFATAPSFWVLCIWAIPYGLGAGSVDAALNNFAALHFSSRKMNWLHACWGVGAAISPFVMSFALTHQWGWRSGYRIIGVVQLLLCASLFATLSLWPRSSRPAARKTKALPIPEVLKVRGVKWVCLAFFGYCSLEAVSGLWAATYLVQSRGVTPTRAALFASFFYLGITIGRIGCGFFADAVGDTNLIRYGTGVVIVGIACVLMPLATPNLALAGLIIIGTGCAPIYPAILHATPANFGTKYSQGVIGIQMASAYVGSTFMPPIYGFFGGHISQRLYPIALLILCLLMLFCFEALMRSVHRQPVPKSAQRLSETN